MTAPLSPPGAAESGSASTIDPPETGRELSPGFLAAGAEHAAANPLRDARDRRIPRLPEPCALVVFGITGDLSRKKLIPAVYDLASRGLLPPGFVLLGFARQDWGDGSFEEIAKKCAQAGCRTPFSEKVWDRLAQAIRFVPGSFDDDAAFDTVARTLAELSETHGIQGNAAFYLSIPPPLFPVVLTQMARTGMNRDADGWRRVVVEKPFGHDLGSARSLNTLVDTTFSPDNVFRIDHYLGKETVQNLLALRFANALWEPIWNAEHVDSVQITMAEDVGIGGRAGFYDDAGAGRDVLQNHLLQLLALTAMEEPFDFSAAAIATEKRKVLEAVRLPEDLGSYSVRGQYARGWLGGREVPGYVEEGGIPSASHTETYAAVRLNVDNRRWAGVPFYARTGKRLPRRVTEIAVLFKRAPHLPFAVTDTDELGNNQLVIRVQPDEGITLRFGSKVPATQMEVRDVSMDFSYSDAFTDSSPEAYERLILDVLLGDATLFPRTAEVEASWRMLDPLEEHWATVPPEPYESGTWGPAGAEKMLERDGRTWRRP